MLNQIICVHVGDKYDWSYVEKLYSGVRRNADPSIRFTVLTDKIGTSLGDAVMIPVDPIPRLTSNRFWWYKMQAFSPEVVQDQNLLLDIDVVISGNLDRFLDHEPARFRICQDFNRHWYKNYAYSNSSVVGFDRKHASKIWAAWSMHPDQHIRGYRGDQDFLDSLDLQKLWWPYPWVQSWKWEVDRGGMKSQTGIRYHSTITEIDSDCSVIAFHGKPDPHEVNDRSITDLWIV